MVWSILLFPHYIIKLLILPPHYMVWSIIILPRYMVWSITLPPHYKVWSLSISPHYIDFEGLFLCISHWTRTRRKNQIRVMSILSIPHYMVWSISLFSHYILWSIKIAPHYMVWSILYKCWGLINKRLTGWGEKQGIHKSANTNSFLTNYFETIIFQYLEVW